MIPNSLKQLGLVLLLLALQVLVFNHVQIFGYATPLICIYFIIALPATTSPLARLFWGFTVGVAQDTFANTPGMMAASLTLVAFCQNWLLTYIGGQNSDDDKEERTIPAATTLGTIPFLRYAGVAILLQNTVFYLLEAFSVFNIGDIVINIVGSTLLSLLIVWAIDSIRKVPAK